MLKIGQRVMYRGGWGTEAPQPGIIKGKGDNDGRTVYDVALDRDTGKNTLRWGYADQFTPIVR